uniref:Uncharacterized protein n=1 Tax=Brassica campestris TaxID=3711 RepID=M4E6K5_BRACM
MFILLVKYFDFLPFAASVISARVERPLTRVFTEDELLKYKVTVEDGMRLAKEYSPIPRIDWKRKPLQTQVKKLTFNRFLNLIEILIASEVIEWLKLCARYDVKSVLGVQKLKLKSLDQTNNTMKGVKKAYYRPKAPVAKRAVRIPHSSLPEMRGVFNCDLTVTDRIGEDTSGERNLTDISGERHMSWGRRRVV